MARSRDTTWLAGTPFIVVLSGITCLAMLVPAIHASWVEDFHAARTFLYASILGSTTVLLIGIATAARPRSRRGLDQLLSLLGAFVLLPAIMAVPFYETLRTTSFLSAYVEMVSCFTTTGAEMFDPERLSPTLHLWRALVAWMGGLLIWIAAAAILAPRHLGGFEVTTSAEPGQGLVGTGYQRRATTATRLMRVTTRLAPVYAGLTLGLWASLVALGDTPLVAFVHATSTLSTSGISAIGGVSEAASGVAGELVIALFLLFALSRLTFSSDTVVGAREALFRDPEFRLGLSLIGSVTLFLFLRHWIGAIEVSDTDIGGAVTALWGATFTVLSFLTTTGFESRDWFAAQNWSGLPTTGLLLMGLALVGGGVATTAGGVKLLRVFVLFRHGRREVARLVHPSMVGAAMGQSRRIRRQGAFIAFVFFMLFALSLAVSALALTASGLTFDDALVLSVAALSTTGPLATAAPEAPIVLAQLGAVAKLVFAAAMILGRLETLAIIALLTPELWRN
ncbi:TrkH family potassium uptake protein [Pseudaestuariivita atlantica]|uniref:Potassium transporter TrkH n=1 Tax=Pseudaestuariivita atlantica TaxID=1317121 RepID=A0A0L1JNS0_9RHOB|nr:potassium transporter TrkG [Pseudaestuariivita atlantica]KNG93033.1 potassium transporter TrkH [Pseudaestuariivita atlantica]